MAKPPKQNTTETRQVGQIDAHDRRTMALIHLLAADARRLARSVESRAEWLERRREPDPLIREAVRREAAHCRRLAALVADAAKGGR